MTDRASEKAYLLTQLQALESAPGLTDQARVTCQALIREFQNPVRLGVFGLPGVGKRSVVNALHGEIVVDPALALPSFDIGYGRFAETCVVLPDGATVTVNGYPDHSVADALPVFLQIQSPSHLMAAFSTLLVAADATPQDMSAALQWAASRVDVAIWCTQSWSSFEREIWMSGPEALTNHALLAVINTDLDPAVAQVAVQDGFDACLHLPLVARDDPVRTLRDRLLAMIEEATEQDVFSAQIFLRKHGTRLDKVPSRAVSQAALSARPVPVTLPAAVSAPSAAETDAIPEEARTALAGVFQTLRRSADTLWRTLPDGPVESAHVLSGIETIFETVSDRIDDLELLDDVWPDLCVHIRDAYDLALLMRVEAGAAQVEDAAMLLLQVRREMEMQLAA